MHIRNLFFLLIAIVIISSCKKNKEEKANLVRIETTYGDMVVKLYDATPKHSQNFLKLVKEDFYDGLLFHRVIDNFMIQGGDPEFKDAQPREFLGEGDIGYTIPPEFVDSIIHKKGAVASARMGDDVNPDKKSSGCQFYIVQGKVFTSEELKELEQKVLGIQHKTILNKRLKEEENRLMDEGKEIDYQSMYNKINKEVIDYLETNKPYKFSEYQKEIYTTIGGTPHLDGNYTIFGEVIEGLDVIDKIASAKTDKNDRPIKDIKMKIKIIQ